MKILILIVTGIAALMILSRVRSGNKNVTSNIIIALIAAIVLSAIGTYEGCADGWQSTSIGKQGACSHHGGVETFINIFGTGSIAISAIVILIFMFSDSDDPSTKK